MNISISKVGLSVLVFLCLSVPAFALADDPAPSLPTTVAPNCTVPTVSPTRHIFYIDPVNGTSTGDGSQAHPWRTLAEVVNSKIATAHYLTPFSPTNNGQTTAINPTAPVHGGDVLYLMSGNHGDVNIWAVNSDFITVAPYPGQKPVLQSLLLWGSAKWIFSGIKVENNVPNGFFPLVTISSHGFRGPVNDVIFDNNLVTSQEDVSNWTQQDWLAHARGGLGMDGGGVPYSNCLTITNNKFYNVRGGVFMGVDRTLFSNNVIDNFADDALDFAANDLVITKNVITNARDLADGNHPDGMQGQIGRGTAWRNILIDSNTVIRQTIPNLPFANSLQGISAFDNNWTNVTVTNNIVISNGYHGISFSSVHGGLIANNTVLFDGAGSTTLWIAVGDKTHQGSSTNDVIVRNNASTQLSIGTPGATADHNVAAQQAALLTNGVTVYNNAAGMYGTSIWVDPTLNSGFVKIDTVNKSYDLHLLPTSPAVGRGVSDKAPGVDIEGTVRQNPIALGAYASPYTQPTIPPTITLSASATSTIPSGSVTLTWSTTRATSCTASGAWSGTKALSGSASSGAIWSTSTYTLTCVGEFGSTTKSTTISVPLSAASGAPATILLNYTFDQANLVGTSTVVDVSNNGNNAALRPGATIVAGNNAEAVSIDGANGYVLGSIAQNVGITGSISFWVKTSDTTRYKGFVVFSTGPSMWLETGSKVRVSGLYGVDMTGGSIPTNTWTNFVYTWDSTYSSLYQDGVIKARKANATSAAGNTANAKVYIGSDRNIGGRTLVGLMDDVRVYGRALTDAEVLKLYEGPSPLALKYTFDQVDLIGISTVKDVIHGNNATLLPGATLTQGHTGEAVSVDGNTGYVLGTLAQNVGDAGTMSFWVKTSDTTRYKGFFEITPGPSMWLETGSKVRVSGLYGVDMTGGNILPDTWTQFVYTWDGTAGTLYQDGLQRDRKNNVTTTITNTSSSKVYIGSDRNIGGRTLAGTIDDIRLYTRALTSSEVLDLYQENSAPATIATSTLPSGSNLALKLTFDKATMASSTIYDTSGHNLNGTLVNGPSLVSGWSNKYADAISLMGAQGVNLGAVSLGTLGISNNAVTISAWMNVQDLTPNTQVVIAKGATNSSAAAESFNIEAKNFNNRPSADFSDGTNILRITPSYGTYINSNTWYHVISVLNGTSGYLYLNGVLIASSTNPNFGTLQDKGILSVGYDGSATRNYFTGYVDEVRIYNRAFTATEAMQLYQGILASRLQSSQTATVSNAGFSIGNLFAGAYSFLRSLLGL